MGGPSDYATARDCARSDVSTVSGKKFEDNPCTPRLTFLYQANGLSCFSRKNCLIRPDEFLACTDYTQTFCPTLYLCSLMFLLSAGYRISTEFSCIQDIRISYVFLGAPNIFTKLSPIIPAKHVMLTHEADNLTRDISLPVQRVALLFRAITKQPDLVVSYDMFSGMNLVHAWQMRSLSSIRRAQEYRRNEDPHVRGCGAECSWCGSHGLYM